MRIWYGVPRMGRTLGHHRVKSGYGQWLTGDSRGHWSEACDEQIGFVEPHMLHEGDPIRLRMAEERMKYAPVRWTNEINRVLADVIDHCQSNSLWRIVAAAMPDAIGRFSSLIVADHGGQLVAGIAERFFTPRQLQIVFNHHARQIFDRCRRLPTEFLPCF